MVPLFFGDVTRLGDLPYLETPDECVNMLNEQCSKPLLFDSGIILSNVSGIKRDYHNPCTSYII